MIWVIMLFITVLIFILYIMFECIMFFEPIEITFKHAHGSEYYLKQIKEFNSRQKFEFFNNDDFVKRSKKREQELDETAKKIVKEIIDETFYSPKNDLLKFEVLKTDEESEIFLEEVMQDNSSFPFGAPLISVFYPESTQRAKLFEEGAIEWFKAFCLMVIPLFSFEEGSYTQSFKIFINNPSGKKEEVSVKEALEMCFRALLRRGYFVGVTRKSELGLLEKDLLYREMGEISIHLEKGHFIMYPLVKTTRWVGNDLLNQEAYVPNLNLITTAVLDYIWGANPEAFELLAQMKSVEKYLHTQDKEKPLRLLDSVPLDSVVILGDEVIPSRQIEIAMYSLHLFDEGIIESQSVEDIITSSEALVNFLDYWSSKIGHFHASDCGKYISLDTRFTNRELKGYGAFLYDLHEHISSWCKEQKIFLPEIVKDDVYRVA